jgi:uncharacterized protein
VSGIIDLFIPKERKFFNYLRQQILLLDKASDLLTSVSTTKSIKPQLMSKQVAQISSYSKEVDKLSHEIIGFLHKTFITPIDREEIKALTTQISIIINSLEKLLTNTLYFKVDKFDKELSKQTEDIHEAVSLLKFIFEEPLSPKRNIETLDRIKDIEKHADDIYRKALGHLFMDTKDAVYIIKQKELYDNAEAIIDNIRITVDLLETVIINNS